MIGILGQIKINQLFAFIMLHMLHGLHMLAKMII